MRIYFTSVVDPRAKRACSALGIKNYLLSYALGQRKFDRNSDILALSVAKMVIGEPMFSAWIHHPMTILAPECFFLLCGTCHHLHAD